MNVVLVPLSRAIAKVDRVRYFKQVIKNRSKWHVTVGHTTVMAEILCFSRDAAVAHVAAAVAGARPSSDDGKIGTGTIIEGYIGVTHSSMP